MFFDEPVKEKGTDLSGWKEILRKNAQEQKKLIQLLCDPDRYVFYADAEGSREYKSVLKRLTDAKDEAARYARDNRLPLGVYWWNVNWEMTAACLLDDLLLEDDTASCRFRRKWDTEGSYGEKTVRLYEHVHYQKFSGSSSVSYGIASEYSRDEIREKLTDYNRNLTNLHLALTAGSNSWTFSNYDQKYYHGADYMLSTDYILQRSALDTMKRNELYSDHKRTTVNVSGYSANRDTVYLAGAYRVINGTLTNLNLYPYEIESRTGREIPDLPEIGRVYSPCRAAWQIAQDENVRTVLPELLCEDLVRPADSFDNAVFQAELFTCFADKLTV